MAVARALHDGGVYKGNGSWFWQWWVKGHGNAMAGGGGTIGEKKQKQMDEND